MCGGGGWRRVREGSSLWEADWTVGILHVHIQKIFFMCTYCAVLIFTSIPLLTPSELFLPNNPSFFICFVFMIHWVALKPLAKARWGAVYWSTSNSAVATAKENAASFPSTFNCQQLPGRDGTSGAGFWAAPITRVYELIFMRSH